MKNLLLILLLLFAGCTRVYYVIVVPDNQRFSDFNPVHPIPPGYYDDLIYRIPTKADTASFLFRLERGDFMLNGNDSFGVLDVKQGGLGIPIRNIDTTGIGDRGDTTFRGDITFSGGGPSWTISRDSVWRNGIFVELIGSVHVDSMKTILHLDSLGLKSIITH